MNAGCTFDQAKAMCADDYDSLTTAFNDRIVEIVDAEALTIGNQPGFKKTKKLDNTVKRTKRFYQKLLKTYFLQ